VRRKEFVDYGMQNANAAVVIEVIPVGIHEDRFYDVIFYYETDPKKTPHTCRLGPEAVPLDIKQGMRVRVKAILSTILGLESIG